MTKVHANMYGMLYGLTMQDLNTFPFEVIKKWLPSSKRSKNPGAADCLDLQIMTDKGARDLRMRCADQREVQQVLLEMQLHRHHTTPCQVNQAVTHQSSLCMTAAQVVSW